jgi:hypothetical protein
MSWLDTLTVSVRKGLIGVFPALGAVDAAREFISDAVATRVREEACAKAYELLAQTHRDVLVTVLWQNALLLASLVPVYYWHSAVPFYVAYAIVLGYSTFTVVKARHLIKRLLSTRSIHRTLAEEVLAAMEKEITQRQLYQRKVVEWLGPDLRTIADGIARKLKPDVVAAVLNMTATLLLAFVAFRLFAIPLLELRALH